MVRILSSVILLAASAGALSAQSAGAIFPVLQAPSRCTQLELSVGVRGAECGTLSRAQLVERVAIQANDDD